MLVDALVGRIDRSGPFSLCNGDDLPIILDLLPWLIYTLALVTSLQRTVRAERYFYRFFLSEPPDTKGRNTFEALGYFDSLWGDSRECFRECRRRNQNYFSFLFETGNYGVDTFPREWDGLACSEVYRDTRLRVYGD